MDLGAEGGGAWSARGSRWIWHGLRGTRSAGSYGPTKVLPVVAMKWHQERHAHCEILCLHLRDCLDRSMVHPWAREIPPGGPNATCGRSYENTRWHRPLQSTTHVHLISLLFLGTPARNPKRGQCAKRLTADEDHLAPQTQIASHAAQPLPKLSRNNEAGQLGTWGGPGGCVANSRFSASQRDP